MRLGLWLCLYLCLCVCASSCVMEPLHSCACFFLFFVSSIIAHTRNRDADEHNASYTHAHTHNEKETHREERETAHHTEGPITQRACRLVPLHVCMSVMQAKRRSGEQRCNTILSKARTTARKCTTHNNTTSIKDNDYSKHRHDTCKGTNTSVSYFVAAVVDEVRFPSRPWKW